MEVYLRNQEYKVVDLSELIYWNSINVIASYGPPAFNSKPRQRHGTVKLHDRLKQVG